MFTGTLHIFSEVPARAFGDMQPSANQTHEESQPQHSHLRGMLPFTTKQCFGSGS